MEKKDTNVKQAIFAQRLPTQKLLGEYPIFNESPSDVFLGVSGLSPETTNRHSG